VKGSEPAGGRRSTDSDRQSRSARITVEQGFPAAPLERNARVLTALAGLVAIGGSAALAVGSGGLLVLVGSPTLLVALLAAPLALSPAGYAVGAGDLAVLRRGARPLLFPLGTLLAARPTAMPRSVRLLGSGGLFGWWGRYRNRSWGSFRAYATDRRSGVLLEWPGFRLYVSPEDPQALCQAVLSRSGSGRRR
jgi:hypothetical protein